MKIACNYTYPKEILDLIKITSDGPFIAGGSSLSIYEGDSIHTDIDVFFASAGQLDNFYKSLDHALSDMAYVRQQADFVTDNAVTIFIEKKRFFSFFSKKPTPQFKIQLISKGFFPNIEAVFNTFDLSICQIGLSGDGWHCTEKFLESFNNKTCEILQINKDTLKRCCKYWVRGYEPTNFNLDEMNSVDLLFSEGIY